MWRLQRQDGSMADGKLQDRSGRRKRHAIMCLGRAQIVCKELCGRLRCSSSLSKRGVEQGGVAKPGLTKHGIRDTARATAAHSRKSKLVRPLRQGRKLWRDDSFFFCCWRLWWVIVQRGRDLSSDSLTILAQIAELMGWEGGNPQCPGKSKSSAPEKQPGVPCIARLRLVGASA